MKKFLLKTLCFVCIPTFCWALAEAFLPPTFFTFRHYEALLFDSSIPHIGNNYPNVNSTIDAVGDLCHHTPKAIIKREHWVTDKLGFRNDAFIARPDVIFVGDSFLQGSGMSQNEILTNQLSGLMPGVGIYNMSPARLSQFDYYLKSGIIRKPKVVVFEIVERDLAIVPEFNQTDTGKLRQRIAQVLEKGNLNVWLSKIIKAQSLAWLRARVNGAAGKGVPSRTDADMFFLRGSQNPHPAKYLEPAANAIAGYKAYCEANGIRFIFMPMPDKETVYFEMVPFEKQPDFLVRLDSILQRKGVQTINTVAIYNRYRRHGKTMLYHNDDTHWNANGVKVIAGELAGVLNEATRKNTKMQP